MTNANGLENLQYVVGFGIILIVVIFIIVVISNLDR